MSYLQLKKCSVPGCERMFEPYRADDSLCEMHKRAITYEEDEGLAPEDAEIKAVEFWAEKRQKASV